MPSLRSTWTAIRLLFGNRARFWSSDRTSEDHPWPDGFVVARAPVYARNEIFIDAPVDRVFANICKGPALYRNAEQLEIEGGGAMALGSRFTWVTMGSSQTAAVEELVDAKVFAFHSRGGGADVYHRWFVRARDGGTELVTEEIQKGITPALLCWFLNPAIRSVHQDWVESIKRESEDQTR